MADGFNPTIKNTIYIIVFALCILMFAYQFIDNSPYSNTAVLDNAKFNVSGRVNALDSNIDSFTSKVNDAAEAAGNSEVSATSFLFLIFEAAFAIPKMMLGVISSAFVLISQILFPSLGGAASVAMTLILGIIASTMLITLIFLFIKMVRTGESQR